MNNPARLMMHAFTVAILLSGPMAAAGRAQGDITPSEARAIAREAYIYGFPLVDNYRIQYAYFVDPQNPEYKGPWNQIRNTPRVFTPEDKAIQTPNSDTPYSFVGLDLRAEPVVLTIPPIEKGRYFSVQLIDLYTHNFAYIGSRTTGNGGGSFLLAGPGWEGAKPEGIAEVIRSETELAFAPYRTQLFNPGDLENVKKVQAGYAVQKLSAFLGKAAPPAVPEIEFPAPLTPDQQKSSLEFFNLLNFVLRFCPPDPSEQHVLARFARIGVGGGKKFDGASLTPEMRDAIAGGMADAWQEYEAFIKNEVTPGKVTSGDVFGTRDYLKNNYLYRMTGAVLGIYGNSKEEAMYPMYRVDATGQPLNAGENQYTLHFPPGRLPPVNAFWSLTMYELPSSLLTTNPLNRYLINSPMLPDLKKDADGGLTLYIQNASPGPDKESNWLPAPKGPFWCALRLYWPKDEALSGAWKQPAMQKAN